MDRGQSKTKVPYQIHDNRWHEVSIIRPDINQHIVRVDDSTTVDTLPDSRSVHYDLKVDEVYVGGVPKTLIGGGGQLPKQLKSREGFQGCLASISLNDEYWKLADHYADIPTEFRGSMKIKEGCDGNTYTLIPLKQCMGVISTFSWGRANIFFIFQCHRTIEKLEKNSTSYVVI